MSVKNKIDFPSAARDPRQRWAAAARVETLPGRIGTWNNGQVRRWKLIKESTCLVLLPPSRVVHSLRIAADMRLAGVSPEAKNPARLSLILKAHWNNRAPGRPFSGGVVPLYAAARTFFQGQTNDSTAGGHGS